MNPSLVEKWLTPEGIKAAIETVLVIMALVTTIFSMLGKKDAAAKVDAISDKLRINEDKLVNATKVGVALVQGVQNFRENASLESAAALKSSIMDATDGMGIEHVVQPFVKAVTENQGSVDTALTKKENGVLTV